MHIPHTHTHTPTVPVASGTECMHAYDNTLCVCSFNLIYYVCNDPLCLCMYIYMCLNHFFLPHSSLLFSLSPSLSLSLPFSLPFSLSLNPPLLFFLPLSSSPLSLLYSLSILDLTSSRLSTIGLKRRTLLNSRFTAPILDDTQDEVTACTIHVTCTNVICTCTLCDSVVVACVQFRVS